MPREHRPNFRDATSCHLASRQRRPTFETSLPVNLGFVCALTCINVVQTPQRDLEHKKNLFVVSSAGALFSALAHIEEGIMFVPCGSIWSGDLKAT